MPVHSSIPRSFKSEAVMPIVQTFALKVLPVAAAKENSSARVERAFAGSHSRDLPAKSWQVWKSENYSSVTCTRMELQQEPCCPGDATSGDQSQDQAALQSYHTCHHHQRSIAQSGQPELYRSNRQPALVLGYYVSVDARRMGVSCHCVGCIFAQDRWVRFRCTFNSRLDRRSPETSITQPNGECGIDVSLGPRQPIRQRCCANNSQPLPHASKYEQHRMLLRQCNQRNVLSYVENGIDFLGAL